jgi:hypothetical protein
MPSHFAFAVNFLPRYPRPPKIYFQVIERVLAVRKYVLKHIALPRPDFLRHKSLEDRPDGQGRRAFVKYDADPFYVRPTLWNRWGPSAWLSRLLGLPLPGDNDHAYHPEGYLIPEIGPDTFLGKGMAEADETIARLQKERTGGCPFSVVR